MTNAEQTAAALDNGATAEGVDDKKGAHLPGDSSMWVFVLGDLVIFSSYFIIFMVYRNQERQLFLESQQHLSLDIGIINTLVLLASSWFVARSVQSTRADDYGR